MAVKTWMPATSAGMTTFSNAVVSANKPAIAAA
jgi:hypothetical protein